VITPLQNLELVKPVCRTVYFLELQFASGTQYINSSGAPLYWRDALNGIGQINTAAPSLALSFIGDSPSLTPYIGSAALAVTRAGATATRVNSTGIIETMAANTPRFDYDPVTLAYKGLLIEDLRTNLLPVSVVDGTWSINAGGGTLNYGIAPDGTNTTFRTTAAAPNRYKSGSVTSGQITTYSIFVKAAATDALFMYIDGAFGSGGVSASATASWANTSSVPSLGGLASRALITSWWPGWYRLEVSFTPLANAVAAGYVYTVSANSEEWWGAQLEPGGSASSYIPTAGATVTRNADDIMIATLGSWFNAAEGTVVAEFIPGTLVPGWSSIFTINDGTSVNRLDLGFGSDGVAVLYNVVANVAVVSALTSGGVSNVGSVSRAAYAYKNADFAESNNGLIPGTQVSGALPVVTRAQLGNDAFNRHLNGHLRRVLYYNKRLINSDLVTLSRIDIEPFSIQWSGLGGVGEMDVVEESDTIDAKALSFTLNHAQPGWLALAVGNVQDYRGRPAKLYFCPLNEGFQLIDTPQLCWRGIMDTIAVGLDKDVGKITLKCETSAYGLKRRSSLRYNSAQQKKKYPGDTGLDNLNSLIANPQLWLSKLFQQI
jgi:hypothetical protein